MNLPSLILNIKPLHRGAMGANHVGQRHDSGKPAINLRPRCQARAMKSRDDATPRRIMTATEVAEYLKVQRGTIL